MTTSLPVMFLLTILVSAAAAWGMVALITWKPGSIVGELMRVLGILVLAAVFLAGFALGSCFGIVLLDSVKR